MDEKTLRQLSQKYADKSGYKLNPDEKNLSLVLKGLIKNEETHGYRFCPCRALTGDLNIDRDNICPCKWHRDEIKKDGHCRCMLFVRKGFSGKK